MAIRDHPIAQQSPWQNGHAERLIGSIHRECLDHVVIFGEAHLRQVLKAYAAYYNNVRTHLSLGKDAPLVRAVQRFGKIAARSISAGFIINIAGSSFWQAQADVSDGGELAALGTIASQRDSNHAIGGIRPFFNQIKLAPGAPAAGRSVV
jgi:hypothetical protein